MARKTQESAVRSTWHVTTRADRPVYVVGSTVELGCWHLDKALKMKHAAFGGDAHHWRIDLSFPRGQELEFKFVEKTPDGGVQWEAGDNRVFTAANGESCVEWGMFHSS